MSLRRLAQLSKTSRQRPRAQIEAAYAAACEGGHGVSGVSQ
jgi:hypothetical protein